MPCNCTHTQPNVWRVLKLPHLNDAAPGWPINGRSGGNASFGLWSRLSSILEVLPAPKDHSVPKSQVVLLTYITALLLRPCKNYLASIVKVSKVDRRSHEAGSPCNVLAVDVYILQLCTWSLETHGACMPAATLPQHIWHKQQPQPQRLRSRRTTDMVQISKAGAMSDYSELCHLRC